MSYHYTDTDGGGSPGNWPSYQSGYVTITGIGSELWTNANADITANLTGAARSNALAVVSSLQSQISSAVLVSGNPTGTTLTAAVGASTGSLQVTWDYYDDQILRTIWAIGLTVDFSNPAGPGVVFYPFPSSAVNSGVTYTVEAQGSSPGSYLDNVLIDKSTDGGSTWIPWAHEGGLGGVSFFQNTGNPSTDIGPASIQWRATATDLYGQAVISYWTVTVNPPSSPSVTPSPSYIPPTPSNTPVPPTPSNTPTSSPPLPTPSNTPTSSPPLPTPSNTPTHTPAASFIPPTPTPSVTRSPGASPTPAPTVTPTPTVTPSVTITPTVTPSISVSPGPSPTPSPTPSTGVLAVYTPWVVAKTLDPIWVQSVYPNSSGFTGYAIDFGDGRGPTRFNALSAADNFFLYTYTLPASSQSYYTATISGSGGAGGLPRTLANRFYIKNSLPTVDVATFYNPLTDTLQLPYSINEVLVGSNEWAVSDVINASYTKLYKNFEYLVNISQSLQFTNQLQLVEWTPNLFNLSASYWHTQIPGLNNDNSFGDYATVSATGQADGIIKNFKSYRFTNVTAPDYYNYIVLASSTTVPTDHIQVRTNNYENSLILSATSIGPNMANFTSISSIDIINGDMYVLCQQISGPKIYRISIDPNSTPQLTVLNYHDGIITPFKNATKIKGGNNLLYVADTNNCCIKIYNTSLSFMKAICTDPLSANGVLDVEINRSNGNLFVLNRAYAPVAPIITFVDTQILSPTNTLYTVQFVHDGLRLADVQTTSLSSFALYGTLKGASTLIPLTSAVTLSATRTLPYTSAQTLQYMAASGMQFEDFAVVALGLSGHNSVYSNTVPIPSNYYFKSPYHVREYDYNGSTVNSFDLPSNTSIITPPNNIQSTDTIVEMVIDPTGAFIYFVTDQYVYKYLTNGEAINRLSFPSFSALGDQEYIKAAFIDDRLNFFIATSKRIFKFVDIPQVIQLFDVGNISSYFYPLSSITIQPDEFIQDWVYNKSILRLAKNFDILYKAISSKFNISLDSAGNLQITSAVPFSTGSLSATDIKGTFVLTQDLFVHSNEFVTSSVVNRTLQNLYNLQLQTLQLIAPRVVKQLPTNTNNTIVAIPCITPTPSPT